MNAQAERGWWQRNLKWVILIGALALLASCAALIGGIGYLLVSTQRSIEAYQVALARAQTHPDVIARLGEPIEAGWLASGSYEFKNGEGKADLSIPLSGPRGEGTLAVFAHKQQGAWVYRRMELRSVGADTIELRSTAEQATAATTSAPVSTEADDDS